MANTIFTCRNFCFGICTMLAMNVIFSILLAPAMTWVAEYRKALKNNDPNDEQPTASIAAKGSLFVSGVGVLGMTAGAFGMFFCSIGDIVDRWFTKGDDELATATDNGDPELASASDNVDPEPVTATDQEDGESGAPSMAYTLPILLGLVSTLFLM
eukprot:985945_1